MHDMGDLHSADALSDEEVIAGISNIVDFESRLAAYKYSYLAQFNRRGLNLKVHHSSPQLWLARRARVAHGNAQRQFDTANWLTEWSVVLDALAAGNIHAGHVGEIRAGCLHIIEADSTLTAGQIADAVDDLLSVAFERTPQDVQKRARELGHAFAEAARARYEKRRAEQAKRDQERRAREEQLARRREQGPAPDTRPAPDTDDPDADGPDPEDDPDIDSEDDDDVLQGPPPRPVAENADLNTLEIYLQSNGRTVIRGDIDQTLAEKFRTRLAEFNRPTPAPDGTRDPRSAPQRNADALSRILDTGRDTSSSASPARVNVTVTLKDLISDTVSSTKSSDKNPHWPFHLTWTGPISHGLARLLACDADLNPVILDDNGIPLAMGRTVRLATTEQRAAVTIRDRCCVKCGKAAQFCQVHHIVYWANRGTTDLTNLVLVCGDCHNDIHHRGWEVAIGDDGHPYVTPPVAIDPERKPMPSYHRRRKPAA